MAAAFGVPEKFSPPNGSVNFTTPVLRTVERTRYLNLLDRLCFLILLIFLLYFRIFLLRELLFP